MVATLSRANFEGVMIASARSILNVACATAESTVAQATNVIRRLASHDGYAMPQISHEYQTGDESTRGFMTETDMLPVLSRFARTQWIAPYPLKTWVILEGAAHTQSYC